MVAYGMLSLFGSAMEKFLNSRPSSNLSDLDSTPTKKLSDGQLVRQRQQMVEQQIRQRGITHPAVLAAFLKVPRHQFVSPEWREFAYQDGPLPIGDNQTISQPYIVAAMTEAADISPQDKVLEIGTGSGYQTAILGELAKTVYTVEIIPHLAQNAKATLTNLGYHNIYAKVGDGYLGWSDYAPYDVIIVTAAPPHIPPPLKEQLALNGRMVIPVGTVYQTLLILKKTMMGWVEQFLFPVRFVPLTR